MSSSSGRLARGPEHRLRVALLPVSLDHEARQGAREEGEIVPARNLLEHREAAHAVPSELGLDVDVVDDLGCETGSSSPAGSARSRRAPMHPRPVAV